MGFLDSLFGGGSKPAAPKEEKKAVSVAAPVASEESSAIKPEIIAAISAGINAVMSDDAEVIAAVTAAIIHAGNGGAHAIRIKHAAGNAWGSAGRIKMMNDRLSF